MRLLMITPDTLRPTSRYYDNFMLLSHPCSNSCMSNQTHIHICIHICTYIYIYNPKGYVWNWGTTMTKGLVVPMTCFECFPPTDILMYLPSLSSLPLTREDQGWKQEHLGTFDASCKVYTLWPNRRSKTMHLENHRGWSCFATGQTSIQTNFKSVKSGRWEK